MNRSHEQILAGIEQRVTELGVPLEEVDAGIAAMLGVPTDYYMAYLLVWAAIEAHSHERPSVSSRQAAEAVDSQLQVAIALIDDIARLSTTVYGCTPSAAGHFTRLLDLLLELRQVVHDLDPVADDAPQADGVLPVSRHG